MDIRLLGGGSPRYLVEGFLLSDIIYTLQAQSSQGKESNIEL